MRFLSKRATSSRLIVDILGRGASLGYLSAGRRSSSLSVRALSLRCFLVYG